MVKSKDLYQTCEEGRKTYKAAGIVHSGFRPLFKLCEVRTCNMLRFSELSDRFLKWLLIEVSVVRVTTDEVFCFVSFASMSFSEPLKELDCHEWLT